MPPFEIDKLGRSKSFETSISTLSTVNPRATVFNSLVLIEEIFDYPLKAASLRIQVSLYGVWAIPFKVVSHRRPQFSNIRRQILCYLLAKWVICLFFCHYDSALIAERVYIPTENINLEHHSTGQTETQLIFNIPSCNDNLEPSRYTHQAEFRFGFATVS